MLTIPREITEPGRERDSKPPPPSVGCLSPGVMTSELLSSSFSRMEICFDPRRGGGDSEVSSGYCSGGGGVERIFGFGKEGVMGV